MSRIWAVARHMIAESIRTRVAVVFIVIMAAILLSLPFLVAGDGVTLKSRVQSHLAYSLGSVSFLLSLLTDDLFLPLTEVGLAALLIAFLIAIFMARWISAPLQRIRLLRLLGLEFFRRGGQRRL